MLVSIPFTTRQDEPASPSTDENDPLEIATQRMLVNVDTVTAIHVVHFRDGKIGFGLFGPGLEEAESFEGFGLEDYGLITQKTFDQLIGKADVTVLEA